MLQAQAVCLPIAADRPLHKPLCVAAHVETLHRPQSAASVHWGSKELARRLQDHMGEVVYLDGAGSGPRRPMSQGLRIAEKEVHGPKGDQETRAEPLGGCLLGLNPGMGRVEKTAWNWND